MTVQNGMNIANRIGSVGQTGTTQPQGKKVDSGEFKSIFDSQLQGLQKPAAQQLKGPQALKFSNHAIERMRSRGISFTPEKMQSLENAVTKAAEKGAKQTLVITDEAALIVGVKNNTVVTVMDKANLKENVFTNIDSTVVI